jgi:hypothetical protein
VIAYLHRASAGLVLCAAAAACGVPEQSGAPSSPVAEAGLVIVFEDVVAPGILELEREATVADAEDGAGFWAAVPGLPRPERGVLQARSTGRSTMAALFRAPPGAPITLSAEAARALGIAPGETAGVLVRAVRSEARVSGPSTGS